MFQEAVREFAFGQQYAWMLCMFALMVVYSLTCPLVVPFGTYDNPQPPPLLGYFVNSL